MSIDDRNVFYENEPNDRPRPQPTPMGRGRSRRRSNWLGTFVAILLLVILTCGVVYITFFADVHVQRTGNGLLLYFGTRQAQPAETHTVSQSETPAQAETPEADTSSALAAQPAENPPSVEIESSPAAPATPASEDEADGALSLQEIYKKCIGSVVSITASAQSGKSSGTGIVLSADGYLITNHHVIENAQVIAVQTSDDRQFQASIIGSDEASISELLALNDAVLESVYPTKTQDAGTVECFTYETEKRVAPAVKIARPKALIPVFPGTNCEYDTHRALLEAGADAEQFIIRNLTSADVADSVERFAKAVKDSQIIVIPGGFSGGDEPDGSAKLITAFFRNAAVKEQVTDLLEKRDGLMLGVCNGFQALIKLGLVPYGKIMDTDADFPTLTYNVIGRHQSRLVRTRVCSNKSPWLAGTKVGDIYTVPISHGEGRFLASEELVKKLAENGQIATQYVDLDGYATMDAAFNPNGSICAIEGITSPDGRVFGKMGHTERIGKELYRNVPGQYEMELFTSAVRYFK